MYLYAPSQGTIETAEDSDRDGAHFILHEVIVSPSSTRAYIFLNEVSVYHVSEPKAQALHNQIWERLLLRMFSLAMFSIKQLLSLKVAVLR